MLGNDDFENEFKFEKEKKIFAGMPLREVFFLPSSMDLKHLTTHYFPTDREILTRVTAFAGISSRPEYGKKALFSLNAAKTKIQEMKFSEALIDLTSARKNLSNFFQE